ncbi:hypothetical protein TMEC50S_01096 [Thauera mechernichensis]
MSIGNAVFLALIVLALVWSVVVYNGLVQLKHNIAKAWANIDVLLKQRHDELPKLVEVCRQYKQFEQETLARVTEARARVARAREAHDVPALGAAENLLRAGLGQIFAVAEAYPELKANEHFMQLQTRITALENGIADRREWYNESVERAQRTHRAVSGPDHCAPVQLCCPAVAAVQYGGKGRRRPQGALQCLRRGRRAACARLSPPARSTTTA